MADPSARPCERQCKRCLQLKHHSRFVSRERKTPNTSVWEFNAICRDCEQKERNEKKNTDRPFSIIRQRAAKDAHKAQVAFQFFWTQMNYASLVAPFRAALTNTCQSCGHQPLNERDVHIEHIAPPRNHQDWARLHSRNIRFLCGSCNRTKSKKSHEEWLDEQEGARLSNLEEIRPAVSESKYPIQGNLF